MRWPTSNPKCLNVDFGAEASMDKAIESTSDELAPRDGQTGAPEKRSAGGWDRFDAEEKRVSKRDV